MKATYENMARVIDVYDGDTIKLSVDMGRKIWTIASDRLYGIQAPEVRTKNLLEKKAGLKVRDWVHNQIFGKDILIKSHKDKAGKFGRYLVVIFYENDKGEQRNLNGELVDMGYALPYYGERKVPFTKAQLKRIIHG